MAHALIRSQQTAEARAAIRGAIAQGTLMAVPTVLLIEFTSLLRKLVVRGSLSQADALGAMDRVRELTVPLSVPLESHREAFVLATELGQSDTFDAAGYLTAQHYGAEFWTSDRRFANAAAVKRLPGIRHIP